MGYSYYGPGWAPVRDSETRKGMMNFLKAMYLSIILMVISGLVLGVVSESIFGLDDVQNDTDMDNVLVSLVIMGISGIVILVAGIAALILFIIGLVSIHRGKAEFGPAHEASVRQAIIFLILAIVISVVSVMVAAVLIFGTMSSMNQPPDSILGLQDNIAGTGIITGAISILSAVFQYLFLAYLVKELVNPGLRNRLWAGVGIGVSSSVASFIITILMFNSQVSAGDLRAAIYTSIIPMAISLVAMVIFITCFRNVIARLDSGELVPAPPSMAYCPPPPPPWPQ